MGADPWLFGVKPTSLQITALMSKINGDIAKALQDPRVHEAYAKVGIDSGVMSVDAFNKFVKKEIALY